MNGKKLTAIVLAAVMLLSLAACSTKTETQTGTESYSADTSFTFSDSGIEATGKTEGYEADGTALTISSAGTYLLTGECSDGNVKVKKGTTGVTLILDGLELESGDTAPIVCGKSTEVTILAAEGSVNVLSDTAANNDEENTDNQNAENAVIKCKDGSQVILSGSGELTINANGKNGIKSGATTDAEGEASLTIKELTLNINASVNDAINAEQTLNIESGNLTLSAEDDAVHCDYVLNIGDDGTDGPTLAITKSEEGIEAAELNVLSGNITVISSDDCLNAANSDLENYDFVINISGGSIFASTTEGDGFDSNGALNISGGTIAVWTANRADNQPLDAETTLNITGGTVFAAGASVGSSLNISAQQAYVTFGSDSGTGGSSIISQGDTVSLKNADGSELFSATAECNVSFVLFSSPDLSEGDSVSISSDSGSAATATAQTGTASVGGGAGGDMGGGDMGANGMGGDPGDMQKPDAKPEGGGQPSDGNPPDKP